MNKYIAHSPETDETHVFRAETSTDARHWVIDHLNTSIKWTVISTEHLLSIVADTDYKTLGENYLLTHGYPIPKRPTGFYGVPAEWLRLHLHLTKFQAVKLLTKIIED